LKKALPDDFGRGLCFCGNIASGYVDLFGIDHDFTFIADTTGIDIKNGATSQITPKIDLK
jgi:hypothetical protein